MRAAEFDPLFEEHVAGPAVSIGYERWGKSLWFERDGLRAALLRTELRSTWPFAFTFVIGHDCLRDFEDRLPAPRSRNPWEYPVKLEPSRLPELHHGFAYEPWNLRYPQEYMQDGIVVKQLEQIGRALIETTPRLGTLLSPNVVLDQLLRAGEDAWCERRWIEDYRKSLERP